jgi:hypothetical protein
MCSDAAIAAEVINKYSPLSKILSSRNLSSLSASDNCLLVASAFLAGNAF